MKALASNYKVIQNSVDAIARTSAQPPLVLLEAKSLVSKLSSLDFVLMCIVWNNILDTLNRVNKALQAPGIEIGSVVLHYRILLEHIHSLRDSERFDRFENEAKSVAPRLGYDDENKRAKNRKLFHDETPEEVKLSDCRENFRINMYLVIIDILLSEVKKRKADLSPTAISRRSAKSSLGITIMILSLILRNNSVYSQNMETSRQVPR